MDKKVQLRGIICTLIGGICWGFSGVCGQYLFMHGVNSNWLTVIRLTCAGIILLIINIIKYKKKAFYIWKTPRDAAKLIIFALLGVMFCQYTYLTAIANSNAGTATVLQYLAPVLIMIYVCLKNLRLPRIKEAISIILAVFGTFLLATHGNIATMVLTREGLTWGILAAIAFMLYSLLPGHIMSKWGSLIVNGYGMIIGGLVLAAAIQVWNIDVSLGLKEILAIFALVILGTVAAYTLYLQGVADIGAVKASVLASVEPVSAVLFSALFLGTKFIFIDIIGFACILTTVFLLIKKEKSQDVHKAESN